MKCDHIQSWHKIKSYKITGLIGICEIFMSLFCASAPVLKWIWSVDLIVE